MEKQGGKDAEFGEPGCGGRRSQGDSQVSWDVLPKEEEQMGTAGRRRLRASRRILLLPMHRE